MSQSICFVAAPLIARSGVYRSTIELVQAARAVGLGWTAVIGVSSRAAGRAIDAEGVLEWEVEPSGIGGVAGLARKLGDFALFTDADLVITMVPQADMALALTRRAWVAYLRGLPWPAIGEASRLKSAIWRAFELTALRRAHEVWATTPQLANDAGRVVDRLVPPGIMRPAPIDRLERGDRFVWAARYSTDKNPWLFLDSLRGTELSGMMYGSGPLERELRASAPHNISVPGWSDAATMWRDARAYVGTSLREAFGRSAVEAAMHGIPVILSDEFGCASTLYTDPQLADLFVIPLDRLDLWRRAIDLLAHDDDLHAETAKHVRSNAARLTIDSAVQNILSATSRL